MPDLIMASLHKLVGCFMNVEWPRIKVAPEYRERFVQKDDEIWTTFLSQVQGFLKKEIWISPVDQSEVSISIH